MALTDLQHQVRRIVAGLPEAGTTVALAGGAALIVTGIVQRPTDDLDFFAPHPQPIDPVLTALEAELMAEGLRVTRLRSTPTFARLQVESDTETTRIDLATDYRLMPAMQTEEGAVLAERELAADKTLALFNRAEPRDYIDFRSLAARFSINELCDLAASKDAGFQRHQLAEVLEFVDQRDRGVFHMDDDAYRDLCNFAHAAARELTGRGDEQSSDDPSSLR